MAKANDLQEAYGGEGKTFVLNLAKADLQGYGTALTSLNDMLDKTIAAVRG